MRQRVLSYLNPFFLLVIAIYAVALQTSVFQGFPLSYLQPVVLLLLVVWFALRRGFIEGGVMTLVFAHIMEIHSSAPRGLFYSCYMVVYLCLRGMTEVLVIPRLTSIIQLTFVASILWKIAHLLLLTYLDPSHTQWRYTLALMLPTAAMQGIVGVWVYRGLERFDWITYKDPKARQVMQDDLLIDEEWI